MPWRRILCGVYCTHPNTMTIHDLPTPCLLIENHRMITNLTRMQALADAHQTQLRPHVKTHKSMQLAQKQLDFGAAGLTVAKVGEAETFAALGVRDIRLAYPIVGAEKHARLLRLMEQGVRVSFGVDTPEGARAAADFYAGNGYEAEVLVEVDVNYGRTGVPWNRASSIDFVGFVRGLKGLRLAGIFCHAGQSYHGPEHEAETLEDALARVAREERGMMLSFAARLQEAGWANPESFEISIGSTPSVKHYQAQTRGGFRITEIRPGNYIFHDGTQVGLGVCDWSDCALTVLTTVVSRQRTRSGKEKLYLDAGKKALTSDLRFGATGYGTLLYNPIRMVPHPHARITSLSEEHAWVEVSGGSTMEVGNRVRVVPNHACVSVHTQPEAWLVDGDQVLARIKIQARDGSQ